MAQIEGNRLIFRDPVLPQSYSPTIKCHVRRPGNRPLQHDHDRSGCRVAGRPHGRPHAGVARDEDQRSRNQTSCVVCLVDPGSGAGVDRSGGRSRACAMHTSAGAQLRRQHGSGFAAAYDAPRHHRDARNQPVQEHQRGGLYPLSLIDPRRSIHPGSEWFNESGTQTDCPHCPSPSWLLRLVAADSKFLSVGLCGVCGGLRGLPTQVSALRPMMYTHLCWAAVFGKHAD
jgi:hypothetical protein